MSARIVVTGKIPSAGLNALHGAGLSPITWDHEHQITRTELLEFVKGAEVLITLLTEKVDDELLDAAGSQLKGVCNVAVGYNNIDVAACTRRNVRVTNTPGVLTDATADIAFGLILMVTRRLGEGERVIRSTQPWQWGMNFMLGVGIQNRQLGIIGMGAIGVATARRAKAFGMSIAYFSRSPIDKKIAEELNATQLSLDDLLASSDVVSVHCPSNDATHHLIGTAQFKMMKQTAFLINTARGPIVNEQQLVDALDAGEIAGAGLDVFEFEPAITEGLEDIPDVVLTPHIASSRASVRLEMTKIVGQNVVSFFEKGQAINPVN